VLGEPPLEDWKAVEITAERRELAALAHQREIVAHREVVEHRPLLRAIADAGTAARRRIERRERLFVEKNAPVHRRQIAGQELHQRRLADAVAA
jgi:hypothetical protein